MKKHKSLMQKTLSFLFASVLVCLNVIPAYAYSDSTSVSNHGRIGVVDIELHQSFPSEQTMIVPGQTVSIKSSVENKGKSAWIRVKLEYPASDDGLQELDDSLITFADETWMKIGSYYYLTDAVDPGDTIPFTESIKFPSDWDNSMAETTIGMVFTAEAIQEKNFTPDFKSDNPWYGAVIEAFDSNEYMVSEEGTEQFSVVYKDGAEGLVCIGDDFFSNWGDLMPGDELDGEAVIENRMNLPVKLYFDMENSGDPELLKNISIRITNGKDIIYDGPLSGTIKPAILLKKYDTGDSSIFGYHISIPNNFDNRYAMSDFKVVWTFSAEEVLPEEEPSIIDIIKTGEYNVIIGICGLSITAVTALILYLRKRREAA